MKMKTLEVSGEVSFSVDISTDCDGNKAVERVHSMVLLIGGKPGYITIIANDMGRFLEQKLANIIVNKPNLIEIAENENRTHE